MLCLIKKALVNLPNMLRNLQGPQVKDGTTLFLLINSWASAHYDGTKLLCPISFASANCDLTKLLCQIKKPPFGGLQMTNTYYLRSVTDTLCLIFTGDFRLSYAFLRLSPQAARTLRGTSW